MTAPRPYGLLAELTYRCPLHCPYCSNPLSLESGAAELSTSEWMKVLHEASELGVLHALFSGGEPLQRPDLADLVECARRLGLYSNLITSAVGFSRSRAEELKRAGLDSVQISFQADDHELGDHLAGAPVHKSKLEAAQLARSVGFPLTLNVVLHRHNMDRVEAVISMAEALGAERLELAHTQYYGWAFKNLESLLPDREQIQVAALRVGEAAHRLRGSMEIVYVTPDYFGTRPKPCMNGWGRRYLTVNPRGEVLPCPTAGEIKGMRFDSVLKNSLGWIWNESEAFNRFRGTDWMPEPCRSCDQRELDFGGCRCQAALLSGDPSHTDPACEFSPYRQSLLDLSKGGSTTVRPDFVYRRPGASAL